MSDEMFEVPGFRLREMTAEIRRLLVCAERAEAAIQRVRALRAAWAEREPYHTIEYGNAILDLDAALDSTDPVEAAPKEWRIGPGHVRVTWVPTLGVSPAGAHSIAEILPDGTHPDAPAPGRSGEEKP